MPGNRWIKPLLVSGLLLSITQNSTAGWDCQPSPGGKWVCKGAISPPVEPLQPKQLPPVTTESGRSEVQSRTVQTGTSRAEPEQVPVGTDKPKPEAAEPEENKADTVVNKMAEPEPASTPVVPDEEKSIGSNESPPVQPESAPEAAESLPASTEIPAGDTNKPAKETRQQTDVREQIYSPDATVSEQNTVREASKSSSGEEVAAVSADAGIDRGLNWNQCFPWSSPAPLSFSPAPAEQMLIDADGSILEQSQNQVSLEGNVQVRRAESLLEADSVLYQRTAETLDAEGNVYYEQPGLRLSASQAHFDLATNQGELDQVSYRLSDQGARGDADSASIESRDLTHFEGINYTTCKPGQNGWLLEAEKLDIDKASGVGTARHAKLRFKGVPFLYVPYASFPIDDRRKSGFLFPTAGNSDRTGADLSVPYYFNIAPNMDATFTPRIMSKRGLLLGGEFRYLQEKHGGRIQAEILPDDKAVADDKNNTRGAFSLQSSGRPAPGWTFDTDINYVSNNDYLGDLGESLAVTSGRHLERLGQVRYTGSDWSLLGRAQYFQTIDDTIASSDRPYRRLPQILFELKRPNQPFGLTYHMRSEYVYFGHSDQDNTVGHRFDLQPGISLPLHRQWGYLTPKASLRFTSYSLDNQAQGFDETPDRLLPTFSLDSGLFFERNTSLFGNAVVQTLEPRLFYLLTPYEDQDELPNFDTANITFGFPSLFQENRFSGSDKIGDANQLTAALTSRILSDTTGAELLNASIGQIYYFRDREVQLSGGATDEESSSAVVAELTSELSRNWRIRAGIQWDPHQNDNRVENGLFSVRYMDGAERVLNAEYNYTRDSVEQTDLSGRWPINNRWSLVGRWTYSELFHQTVQAFAGIEYDNCCWQVRLIGQQLLTDIDDDPVNSILLQFQLKGLGGVGNADDEFLESNISGYRANR